MFENKQLGQQRNLFCITYETIATDTVSTRTAGMVDSHVTYFGSAISFYSFLALYYRYGTNQSIWRNSHTLETTLSSVVDPNQEPDRVGTALFAEYGSGLASRTCLSGSGVSVSISVPLFPRKFQHFAQNFES